MPGPGLCGQHDILPVIKQYLGKCRKEKGQAALAKDREGVRSCGGWGREGQKRTRLVKEGRTNAVTQARSGGRGDTTAFEELMGGGSGDKAQGPCGHTGLLSFMCP